MKINNKNIIVFGLGITGKSSIKALSSLGANIYIYDDRPYEEMKDDIFELSDFDFEIIHDEVDIVWEDIYCVLKSPGIRLDNPFVELANSMGVEVISDIELAYRIYGKDINFIAVTGTNGKTTTTSLIAHILNFNGIKAKLVGNIGIGFLWEIYTNGLEYTYVLEMSSFQLSSLKDFKSNIAVITNISEDHTDWHGTYENYRDAKFNIFKNMNKSSVLILNKDDETLNNINLDVERKYFSLNDKADIYLENDEIIYGDKVFERKNFPLVGNHNVANAMASILACLSYGLDFDSICPALKTFKAIEHRVEYVTTINGVDYYNDSKGTNIDSTKVALAGFKQNISLIAGGYDKKVDFDELFEGQERIKNLVLLGQTSDKIEVSALKFGINNIYKVSNMEAAVKVAHDLSSDGDVVLLSPACASWGMYENYEYRGKHFKEIVKTYEKGNKEKK